ncbi:MAG: hypothetical protein V3U35_02350 [Candidatus Neomarinimicrobiota bacterium]
MTTARRFGWLPAVAVALMLLPAKSGAQEFFSEDTSGYYDEEYDEFYDDEFSEGEYYEDEYYDEGGDEGYFEEDDYFDEGEEGYYDEGDEFYDDDAFYDEEGFEEEFLDEGDPSEAADDLELADDSAGEVELQEIEKKKIKVPRVIRGYNAKIVVISPWLVGMGFDSFWYSYIDARMALDLPRKAGAGALAPAYTLEVGTFSFENKHHIGGKFAGVSIQGLMRIPLGPIEASAGGGIYASGSDIRGGMVFGATYRIPFINFVWLTVDSRLTYVQNATATGASYWLDMGGSIGYPF